MLLALGIVIIPRIAKTVIMEPLTSAVEFKPSTSAVEFGKHTVAYVPTLRNLMVYYGPVWLEKRCENWTSEEYGASLRTLRHGQSRICSKFRRYIHRTPYSASDMIGHYDRLVPSRQ